MKRVALIGGGFRPPTKGHYKMIKRAENIPNIDEVIVFISPKSRDNITAENSKSILEVYGFSDKVKFKIAKVSPIAEIYNYIKQNPEQKISWILGYRDIDDNKDIEKRTKDIKEHFPKVKIVKVKGSKYVRGTYMRQAIESNNIKQFYKFIPSHIEKDKVWELIKYSEYL